NIIGSIYFDNGDYNHALDCYQHGLVIRRESHDKWGEAGSLDNIGITYLKLNDLDKAIDYCKQSLKITQSTGDKKGEANTLLHLGEIFQQAGDIGQASRFSNESLEIRKARGDKRGEAEVLLFLVDLNKDRIDTDDHQIFEWLSGALKIADEIKAQDLLSKSYYNLHEYYRQKGNHKQSLIHLEAHLQIEKELHKNTINQKISNLEISHKAETISQRNRELTELNEKIEKANEELKIEASLERVRAVAMGMKEPADMINVCRRISDQLQQLGFKEIRNVQTAIIYPEKHVYLNYQYFTPYDKESIETIDYRLHPDVLEFSRIMLASPDAYYTKTFEGEELKVWREYRKQTNQLPDPKLDATTSSHYYFYSIGSGALGVTTYAPLSEEQIELFKRFRNVFELAYRRFIDIEKALAQAREAQIQLTLERVRARTMAMHHSEELSEVVKLLYQEFDKLKINNESTDIEIGLIDEETGVASIWAHFYLSDGTISTFKLPFTLFEEINDEFKKWKATPVEKRNELFFTTEFSAEQWQRYMNIIEKLPELAEIFRPLLEAKITKWVTHNAYFSHGILTLQGTEAYSQETQEIQKRFAKVFEQTYTRFLDLKKAEAQTREAQIEAALERVRAKSMAMHHSDDLITVINVVQEQLLGLGFHFHAANFVTDYSEKGYTMWLASPGESFPHKIYVPQVGLKYFEAVNAAIEKGSDFATYTLNFEEKNIYFKSLFESSLAKSTSEEGKRKVNESKGMASSVVLLDKVRLNLMNLDMIPFTDEENNILKRFGYVFEQSYTRFLDLQKAEAQAREAQIEAAVEKVRSRSLAMHKSDELQEVVHTVFERLKELNVDFYTAIIILFTEGSKDIVWWLESKANQQYPRILVPFTPVSYFNDLFEKREKGADLLSKCYSFEEKNELFRHLFENTDFKYVPENQKQFLLGAEFATMSVGLAKNTGIHITSYSKKSFSDQDNLIIKRFAKVFDQAYTRFLDLQKAEAQAREAQIETGLERVRSKTMAMHKSEEVTSVAVSLNEELLKLGFEGGSTIIIINRETGDTEQWTGFSEDKSIKSCYVPYFKHPYHDALLDSWKKGENFLVYIIAGDNKISLDEHYFSTGYRIFPESDKKWMKAMGSVTFSHAYMKYGAIHWGPGQLTEEQLRILQRFSKVFEQSYTRFLDLQKAEAQAKEAQIEVALERIRARAMAMHSSNELMDVAYILREQMGLLDQPDLETSVVNLFEEDSDYIHSWHAFREPGSSSGKIINGTVSFRKDSSELTKEMIDHYHSGKKEYTLEATGEKLNEFIQVLINSEPEISNYIGKDPPEKVYYHFATFKGGALLTVSYQPTTEDIKSLQRRAASVFDMAYRRYRDLKKAEAQTREAQIEIAVERVRAKALAMHKSEEILSVVVVLRNELLGLNIPGVSGTTIYLKQDDDRIRMWDLTSVIELEDGFHLSMDIVFPLEETHPELFIRKIWNATEKYSVQIQNRNDLMRTVEWLAAYKKEEAENVKRFIETTDLRNLFHSTVPLANGKLSVDLMEPPPAEMESILQKMATAFDLAYKRFRDLQKAEAQAREAQIEAALERVRAKVMAMTSSKDLNETSLVFGEQLRKLGIDWQFSYFWLIEEAKNENTFWITWPDNKTSLTTYTLAEAEEYFNDCLVSWRAGVKIHDNYVPSEGVQEWLDTFQRIADDAGGEAKKIMVPATFADGVYYYDAMMKYGSFGICINKPATDEEKKIQCRFAIEFER
ncbi:MAG TPA: tetratricopeptide repeat protein, partial [Chitinophagaceae bacterium]